MNVTRSLLDDIKTKQLKCYGHSFINNPRLLHTIDDLMIAITEYIRNVDRAILNTVHTIDDLMIAITEYIRNVDRAVLYLQLHRI
jgi:hypothetical protein